MDSHTLSVYDLLPSHPRNSSLERERVNTKIYARVKSTLTAPFILPQNLRWGLRQGIAVHGLIET